MVSYFYGCFRIAVIYNIGYIDIYMKKRLGPIHILILIVLLTIILAPRPFAGSLDLRSAILFEEAENSAGAGQAYASAAGRLPWMPSLWETAGEKALQAGDVENAIAYLNKSVEQEAISRMGWFYLGTAYHQYGELALAVNAWEQALPLAQAASELASAQRHMGKFSLAISYWQKTIALQPENAAAHYSIGLLFMAISPKDALPELMKAAWLDPALDPTVQGLRTALNSSLISNDELSLFLGSGRALAALGEWDLAAEAFLRAIVGRFNYAEAWAWLGEARQQQDLDASSEMEQAVIFGPQSATVQGLYGLYLQRQGKLEAARSAFQKAAGLEPKDPAWKIAMGSISEQTGNLVAAYEFYFQAVELAPQDASTWKALVAFCLANNVDVAGIGLPAARKLIGLAPGNWESYDLAGQAEFILEQYSAAAIYFKKAIRMDPYQAGPALHLGLVYLQSGDRNSAWFNFNLAKSIDPKGPIGWQAGRLLEQYFP
jgi:tetratricopeptide (TPR) repeat protein